jgi:hypothetical protein
MWDSVTHRGPGNLKWVWDAVAKFIVPDWGDKVNSGIRLSYRPPGYIGWWWAGTSTLSPTQGL